MHYHTGLPYETTDEFLAGAIPFVSAAAAQDHAVVAIMSREKADALREAAGATACAVDFASTDDWYTSQARAFSKFVERARTVRESGRQGLCVLTDPSAAELDDERLRRWLSVENAVNDVLSTDIPLSVMCAYDLNLSGLTRAQIEISHPHMATGEQVCASSNFIAPASFHHSAYAVTRGETPSNARAMAFDVHSLAALRAFVQDQARGFGLTSAKAEDLVIAASEAAANAVEHGGGDAVARLWRSGLEVVCEIESKRGAMGGAAAGFAIPEWTAERGRGIWLMRQLCEWVDLGAQSAGSTVRLHMRG